MMNRAMAAVLAALVLATPLRAAETVRAFLFLKTGEPFATQDTAGPTVATLTDYLGAKTGTKFQPRVLNDPANAVDVCVTKKPPLGIVTPGFYLAYAKALGMEPLLETHRAGVASERYVLVVKKSAPDDPAALKGRTIATTLAAEERYIVSVILQGKLGEEVRLKPTTDVEGAVFDLAGDATNAADAVLLEAVAWNIYQKDEELGPKLKVVFQSDELPRDLVVVFRANADGLDVKKAGAVLKAMAADSAGKQILESIRVDSFADVDQARLTKAQGLFYAN